MSHSAARRAIALASRLVDVAVLVSLTLLVLVGAFALADGNRTLEKASSVRWASLEPDRQGSAVALEDLMRRNPDVVGWLELDGTAISYPVCWSAKPEFYLLHDAEGAYELSGALFATPLTEKDFSGARSIIFGHHMDHDAMFGQLTRFLEPDFFEKHRWGRLWADGCWSGLEIVGTISCDAYDEQVYRGEAGDAASYAAALWRRCEPRRTLPAPDGRRVLLLSTCSADAADGRTVVMCLLGGPPHAGEQEEASGQKTGVGGREDEGLLGAVPEGRPPAALLGAACAGLAGVLLVKKKTKGRDGNDGHEVPEDAPHRSGPSDRDGRGAAGARADGPLGRLTGCGAEGAAGRCGGAVRRLRHLRRTAPRRRRRGRSGRRRWGRFP